MKAFAGAAVVLIACCASSGQDCLRKTDKSLDGKWNLKGVRYEGFDYTPEELKAVPAQQFIFKDGRLITQTADGKQVSDYPYKVDPGQIPPAIDLTFQDLTDPSGVSISPGIYSVNDDSLMICWLIMREPKRPRDFNGGWRSCAKIVFLKRAK